MLFKFKRKVADGLLVFTDATGMVLSASGASVVAIFGKLMLAVVLGAIALGFFLRLAGRRRQTHSAPVRTPAWCYVAAVALAAIEVAVLAEATNLPIRFYQPGFEPWHWALVVIALIVAYVVHMQVFHALTRRQGVSSRLRDK